METSLLLSIFEGKYMLLAVGMTRMTTAFALLPLFSSNLIPALVRNSIFVSLALIVLSVHAPVDDTSLSGINLVQVFAVEAFLGIALGIFFGIFLWAFDAAGEVIDTAIGTSMAMIHDPISGNEVTLFGEFLGRWANFLFMASGGLLLITTIVIDSYATWPIGQSLPDLKSESVQLFYEQFTSFFSLTLMLAAPLLVVIFLIDMSMGLVNRFAQQMNVLFLSISLKSILSLAILAILLPVITEVFIDELQQQAQAVLGLVGSLFQ